MNETPVQRQEINLFTLEFQRGDQAFSFRTITQAAILFFVTLMFVEAFNGWTLWKNQGRMVELNNQHRVVSQRLAMLKQSQPLSQRPKLEIQEGMLQQQIRQRKELQQIMGGQKFGNFDGFSRFLAGLARQANADLSLTQIHLLEGGSTLELEGWARAPQAVPRYLHDLRSEQIFETVRFGVLQIDNDPDYSHKLRFYLGRTKEDPT